MRALDVATKFENLRAKQWPAFQVGFLSPPRLKNSSNNENTVKSTVFWFSVWKSGVQRKELLRKSKIRSRPSLTLCSSDPTPKLKQTWLNLGNDDSISSKMRRTQTQQFLELFSRTLNFCQSLKNLLEFIYSRLHSKSCGYLDKCHSTQFNYHYESRLFSK